MNNTTVIYKSRSVGATTIFSDDRFQYGLSKTKSIKEFQSLLKSDKIHFCNNKFERLVDENYW